METLAEKQERVASQLQLILQAENPDIDVSPGTVLYELTVKPNASILAKQEMGLDVLRDNMSLVQVLDQETPDQVMVDRLLSNFNVARREGERATGTLSIFTRSRQNVVIPPNQRFWCGGIELQPDRAYVGVSGSILPNDTDSFSYVQTREYSTGVYVFTIGAVTVDVMVSVLSTGQICTAVPPIPQVTSVETASTFSGGSLTESTAALLTRARTNINAHVLTGRDNIRAFLTDNTELDVLDAAVFGMGDALVLRDNRYGVSGGGAVDAYVRTELVPASVTATLTGTADADYLWTIEIPAATYPGAYGVVSIRYRQLAITEFTEVFGFTTAPTAPYMAEVAHARYSMYQTLSVQFTAWDLPLNETSLDFEVTVMYMPGLVELQQFVEQPEVRGYGFDLLVKGAVPVTVSLDVTIRYWRGLDAPEAAEFQVAIANMINGKLIGDEYLQSSDVVYACKRLFPQGEVAMPVQLFGRTWVPAGGSIYAHNDAYLKVPELDGLTYQNAFFACFPSNVNVSLIEIVPQ